MSKTPSIQQYLLGLFTTSRIATAEAGGDAKAIARAHTAYDNLTEKDVVFGAITRNETTGKYQTSITCKSRGWAVTNVSFNTGTLKALSRENLQSIAKVESLRMADIPGVFYVDENSALYLVTEKDANVLDALTLTGYSFPASAIKTTLYPEFDVEKRAVGQVDIDHPIVTGRFLLSYINRVPTDQVVDTNQGVEDKPSVADVLKVEGEEKPETLNTEEQVVAGSHYQAVAAPSTGETQTEEPASEKAEVEEPAVVQKPQNNNNKNNRK